MATRTPVYLDFENGELTEFGVNDTIPDSVSDNIFPIGSVIMNTTGDTPSTQYSGGSWILLGSQTVSGATIYYFENQAL